MKTKEEQIQALAKFSEEYKGTLLGDWMHDQLISVESALRSDINPSCWTQSPAEWLKQMEVKSARKTDTELALREVKYTNMERELLHRQIRIAGLRDSIVKTMQEQAEQLKNVPIGR